MVGVAMASAGVTGRGAGDTKAETAAQVTAAFRAAARAKRGQHQKPVDVLSRVFAGSGPGDGRVSPEDFRVAASNSVWIYPMRTYSRCLKPVNT